MSRLISFVPDWMLFLSVLIIGIIIFLYLEEESKETVKLFFLRYGLYLFVICLLIYGWNRWGVVADHDVGQMKYALFIGLATLITYFAGVNYLYREQTLTTSFQANGVAGSCSIYYDLGDYTIFYLGTSGKSDFEGFVLPWYFPKRIVVVPKNSWALNGNNLVSTTQVSKCDSLLALPEYVMKKLEADSRTYFARSEVYYGLFCEELKTEDPDYHKIESQLLKLQRRNNELSEMLDNKLRNFKEFATDTMAIGDKIGGKRFSPGNSQSGGVPPT